jgi:hypothetical protein
MSYDIIAALPIGQSSTSAVYASLLGTCIRAPAVSSSALPSIGTGEFATYMLVQASTAITTANQSFLSWTATTGANGYTVSALAPTASVIGAVAGVACLAGTNQSSTAASGAYFWVCRSGVTLATSDQTVAQGAAVAIYGTAGLFGSTAVTYDTVVARNLAAITGSVLARINVTLPVPA